MDDICTPILRSPGKGLFGVVFFKGTGKHVYPWNPHLRFLGLDSAPIGPGKVSASPPLPPVRVPRVPTAMGECTVICSSLSRRRHHDPSSPRVGISSLESSQSPPKKSSQIPSDIFEGKCPSVFAVQHSHLTNHATPANGNRFQSNQLSTPLLITKAPVLVWVLKKIIGRNNLSEGLESFDSSYANDLLFL